jgi:hypothetical protein
MAFEHNPGRGTMFLNQNRVKETDPTYRGEFKIHRPIADGEILSISFWSDVTRHGSKYYKVAVQDYKPRKKEGENWKSAGEAAEKIDPPWGDDNDIDF